LEKFAADGIRQRAALRHVFSPKGRIGTPFDRLNSSSNSILAPRQCGVKAGAPRQYRRLASHGQQNLEKYRAAPAEFDPNAKGRHPTPFPYVSSET
jgi:hypothetical protein